MLSQSGREYNSAGEGIAPEKCVEKCPAVQIELFLRDLFADEKSAVTAGFGLAAKKMFPINPPWLILQGSPPYPNY